MMSQQTKEVLEGEVPKVILDQLDILRKALLENKTLSEEFAVNVSEQELQKMDEDVSKTTRFLNEQKSMVHKERLRNNALAEKVVRDGRMAAQVSRRHEMLTKNPQYGRMQATEYMHDVAGQHEHSLEEYQRTLAKFEDIIRHLTQDNDSSSNGVSQKDLCAHIQRFDEIFASVANQVYAVNEEVGKVKDSYLEQRRKLFGRYASDPFEKQQRRDKIIDVFANLKGLDAFPSQSAILSMSQYMPKQAVMQQSAPAFGTPSLGPSSFGTTTGASSTGMGGGGSLFGPAAKHPSLGNAASGMGSSVTPFSFNTSGSFGAPQQQQTPFGKPFAPTTSSSSGGQGLSFGQPQQPPQGCSIFGTGSATQAQAPAFCSVGVGQQQQSFGLNQPLQLQQPPLSASATSTTFPNKPFATPTLGNFAPASTSSLFGPNNQTVQQQQQLRLQQQQQPSSGFQQQMHNAGGTLFQSSTKPLFGK